jgi:hypothetical protein
LGRRLKMIAEIKNLVGRKLYGGGEVSAVGDTNIACPLNKDKDERGLWLIGRISHFVGNVSYLDIVDRKRRETVATAKVKTLHVHTDMRIRHFIDFEILEVIDSRGWING